MPTRQRCARRPEPEVTRRRGTTERRRRGSGQGEQPPGVDVNPDGSYDLYFGATAPEGKESNWVQTLPGKSWFVLFRLYGPLQKLNEFSPSAERHSHQARPGAIGENDDNHGREHFLTRLPAVSPGPVAHV